MEPFEMPTTFDSKDEYCNKLLELVQIESYLENLKQQVYINADYIFDLKEQRDITKRIELKFGKTD